MASRPITSWQIGSEKRKWKQWQTSFSWAPKSLWMVTAATKLKDTCSLEGNKSRQHIKKQRHNFTDKGPYSQSCGFFSSYVQMWELGHKEGWAPKNWCFWIVVLGKTWEPLGQKGDPTSQFKENQPWTLIGRTDSEAPIFWSPEAKSWLIGKDPEAGKDWGQEEKGMTEDELAGWHHQLKGHEFEQTGRLWRKGKPGILESFGSKRVRHNWVTKTSNTQL